MRTSFRFLTVASLLSVFCLSSSQAQAISLADRLSGRILLQVQLHGEAWYIDPVSKTRLYLGTAQDAFQLLRLKGLGIRHAELERYRATRFPVRLSGRILLDVDDRGQAYYILPQTLRAVRLGNAEETYQVLRQQGLGITTETLETIQLAPSSLPPTDVIIPVPILALPRTPVMLGELEQRTQALINANRQSMGLRPLVWNETVAAVARTHSENMAGGSVAFGHDGFERRYQLLQGSLGITQIAENVAANTYADPVTTAVQGWLESEGHRRNIQNSVYTQTGIGIVKSSDNQYYFTQIFVK